MANSNRQNRVKDAMVRAALNLAKKMENNQRFGAVIFGASILGEDLEGVVGIAYENMKEMVESVRRMGKKQGKTKIDEFVKDMMKTAKANPNSKILFFNSVEPFYDNGELTNVGVFVLTPKC